jgi:hypothetical protein
LQGVNVTALREVKLLRELCSPHVVRLLDVLPQKRGINLVMEFCESDLEHVIKDRSRLLSAGDIKAYMQVGGRGYMENKIEDACMHALGAAAAGLGAEDVTEPHPSVPLGRPVPLPTCR